MACNQFMAILIGREKMFSCFINWILESPACQMLIGGCMCRKKSNKVQYFAKKYLSFSVEQDSSHHDQ
jgi:hypothetical protein